MPDEPRDAKPGDAASDVFVHVTAVIDWPCSIGAETKIWHFCHVMTDAEIGERCVLGQNVFIASKVRVGSGTKIQNNVSLFAGCTLEEDVFIGPSAVFTNVRNPRAHLERKDAFEPTVVRRGASIGANATVVCGIEIGEYAFVAAGSVVTRSVPAYHLVLGVPARSIGYVCQCGQRLRQTPESSTWGCPCRRTYDVDSVEGSVRPRE